MARSRISSAVRTGLGFVLRPANPLRPLDTHMGEVEGGGAMAARAGAQAFGPESGPVASLAAIADDHERFQAAMRLHGTREDDLPRMEHGADRRFRTWFVVATVALCYAILTPSLGLLGRTGSPLLDFCLPWLILLAVGSKAVRASYDLYILRKRSLVPFRAWLHEPAAWLGAHPAGRTAALALLCLAGAAAGLAPHEAAAQAATPGASAASVLAHWSTWASQATAANDLSLQWMARLFPGAAVAWGGTSSTTDVLIPLFTLFNGVLMALAALSLTWFTVSATVHTAHTGKLLGERYHQIWAPIRICLGYALIAPIQGYCLAQYLVIMMIMGSYGLTNAMWSTYVTAMLSPTSAATLVGPQVDVANQLASQVLRAETCMQVAKSYAANQGGVWGWTVGLVVAPSTVPFAEPPVGGTTSGYSTVWDYGPLCGSLTVGSFTQTAQNAIGAAWNADSDPASFGQEVQAYQAFDTKRTAALGALVAAIRYGSTAGTVPAAATSCSASPPTPPPPSGGDETQGLPALLAASVTPGGTAPTGNGVMLAANALQSAAVYNATLVSAAKGMACSLDTSGRANFQATASALGWASAGALNFTLTRLSAAAVDRAAGAMPAVVGVQLGQAQTDEIRTRMSRTLDSLSLLVANSTSNDYVGRDGVHVREDHQSWNPLSLLFKKPMDILAVGMTNMARLDPVNPMGDIVMWGNASLTAGEALFTGFIVATAASDATEKALENGLTNLPASIAAGVQGSLRAIAPYMTMITTGLFVFGAINAYVLPMVPYIMWFFAVVACATLAIELVLVAPIAAFFHVRYDGQELIDGPQKAIYTLTFHAITRPPLLLFGLILSNSLFAVMASYLNQTFALAMTSSAGNNIIGVVGVLTMMALLLYLHYQLAVRCMSLVHQVPSMAAHIMGAPDLQRGEGQETNQVFAAVGSFVRNQGTSAITAGLTSGKQPSAADRANAEKEKKQAAGVQERIATALEGKSGSGGGGRGSNAFGGESAGPQGDAPPGKSKDGNT